MNIHSMQEHAPFASNTQKAKCDDECMRMNATRSKPYRKVFHFEVINLMLCFGKMFLGINAMRFLRFQFVCHCIMELFMFGSFTSQLIPNGTKLLRENPRTITNTFDKKNRSRDYRMQNLIMIR